MKCTNTPISELLILEPKVFEDERGFFFESYSRANFQSVTGLDLEFVQHNHSRSTRGVLRGLHYQLNPHAQGKLVRVSSGAIFDVAVDLRPNSPTFGKWHGLELSADNKKQIWIPVGFAHGFITLSESAEVLYMTTARYAPEHEASIHWSDPEIGIQWPDTGLSPIISTKDAVAPLLRDAKRFTDAFD